MEKTVVELFAGVGGFRCGLNQVKLVRGKVVENNNWDFVWTNQWEPSTKIQHAFECYTKRFGLSEVHSNVNISEVDKNNIPCHTLLVGGFPCQDYSVARSLSSEKGIEGVKGVLWWEIAEIIKSKRPPFVLLENVDRLLKSPSTQRGRDFGIMLRTFAENGYAVEWRVINASEYGFVQKRRRVFIFAYRKTTLYYKKLKKLTHQNIILESGLFPNTFPVIKKIHDIATHNISKSKYVDLVELSNSFEGTMYNSGIMVNYKITTVKTEAIKSNITTLGSIIEKNVTDEKYYVNKEKLEKWKYLKGSKRIERTKPNGDKYFYTEGQMEFPDALDKPARTMLTSESSINRSSHIIRDPMKKKIRIITPVEAERINGFPDDWTNTGMPDRKRYFMMGNALVVGIVERLGIELEKIIKEE